MSERARGLGRIAALGAAGGFAGAALVLVGSPPHPSRERAPNAVRAADDRAVLGRGELSEQCRQVLGTGASAEFMGREWWCAGRPGGIWRLAHLDEEAACRSVGRAGGRRTVTDQAVHCGR